MKYINHEKEMCDLEIYDLDRRISCYVQCEENYSWQPK